MHRIQAAGKCIKPPMIVVFVRSKLETFTFVDIYNQIVRDQIKHRDDGTLSVITGSVQVRLWIPQDEAVHVLRAGVVLRSRYLDVVPEPGRPLSRAARGSWLCSPRAVACVGAELERLA